MDKDNNENLIPGTNLPKPRIRGEHETDEEYVEYLKAYYNTYFPEEEKATETIQNEEMPTIEEVPVVETEISNQDITNIQNNLEAFADSVIASEQVQNNNDTIVNQTEVDLEPELNFDLNATQNDNNQNIETTEEQEDTYGFNFNTEPLNPTINFDLSGTIESEVENITESNETLNKKVRSFEMFTKAKAFFTDVKNKLAQKMESYLGGLDDTFFEENLSVETGMVR